MKHIVLLLAFTVIATFPSKLTLEDGREVIIRCGEEHCVWKDIDNDACYDPVTKRWEPCY